MSQLHLDEKKLSLRVCVCFYVHISWERCVEGRYLPSLLSLHRSVTTALFLPSLPPSPPLFSSNALPFFFSNYSTPHCFLISVSVSLSFSSLKAILHHCRTQQSFSCPLRWLQQGEIGAMHHHRGTIEKFHYSLSHVSGEMSERGDREAREHKEEGVGMFKEW